MQKNNFQFLNNDASMIILSNKMKVLQVRFELGNAFCATHLMNAPCADPEVGIWGDPPMKNHKNIGGLAIVVRMP